MKYLFGLLSLVVALAIVSAVMKAQGRAAAGAPPAGRTAAASAGEATPSGNARRLEQLARERTTQALQQGADRNARAEP